MNKSSSALGIVKRLASPSMILASKKQEEQQKEDQKEKSTPRLITDGEFERFTDPKIVDEMV